MKGEVNCNRLRSLGLNYNFKLRKKDTRGAQRYVVSRGIKGDAIADTNTACIHTATLKSPLSCSLYRFIRFVSLASYFRGDNRVIIVMPRGEALRRQTCPSAKLSLSNTFSPFQYCRRYPNAVECSSHAGY